MNWDMVWKGVGCFGVFSLVFAIIQFVRTRRTQRDLAESRRLLQELRAEHVVNSRHDLVEWWLKTATQSRESAITISYSVGETDDLVDEHQVAVWHEYIKVLQKKVESRGKVLFRKKGPLSAGPPPKNLPEAFRNKLVKKDDTVGDSPALILEEENVWQFQSATQRYRLRATPDEVLIERVFDWRIVAPRRHERVAALYERQLAGAWIRVYSDLDGLDFRFQVCDEDMLVLNFPSAKGASFASSVGHVIPNRFYAEKTREVFDEIWRDATKCIAFDDYVKELLLRALPEPGLGARTTHEIATASDIPENICMIYLGLLREEGRVNVKGDRYSKSDQD